MILIIQNSRADCLLDVIKNKVWNACKFRRFVRVLLMYQIGPLIGCECNFSRKMRGLKNLGEKVAFFFNQADSYFVKYIQEVNWDQKRYCCICVDCNHIPLKLRVARTTQELN